MSDSVQTSVQLRRHSSGQNICAIFKASFRERQIFNEFRCVTRCSDRAKKISIKIFHIRVASINACAAHTTNEQCVNGFLVQVFVESFKVIRLVGWQSRWRCLTSFVALIAQIIDESHGIRDKTLFATSHGSRLLHVRWLFQAFKTSPSLKCEDLHDYS